MARDIARRDRSSTILIDDEIVQGAHVGLVELHVSSRCLADLPLSLAQRAQSLHQSGDLLDIGLVDLGKIQKLSRGVVVADPVDALVRAQRSSRCLGFHAPQSSTLS